MGQQDLTQKETEVLEALRANIEHEDKEGWGNVYLDNAIDTHNPVVKGMLGSLQKKGLYEPYPDDDYREVWGLVKLVQPGQ